MKNRAKRYTLAATVALLSLLLPFASSGPRAAQDNSDLRASGLKDADHFGWSLPDPFPSRDVWERRAQQLRRKLLISAGLWPERARTPLNARVFDVKPGDGFKVGKVYFESLPGFLATGNIYYPTAGTPPYPAVLSPHGHWTYGRLQNGEDGSIPGRSIDFARQGYVVFAIDMVGYNDSLQLPHDGSKSRAQLRGDIPLPYEPRLFRAEFLFPEAELYGFSLGGLQLWNGIRGYASGRLRIPARTWSSFSWPASYNRSNEILAIQDTITAMASILQMLPGKPLTVVGFEKAGFPTAFAAAIHGGAARVIVDLNGEDPGHDGSLLKLLPAGSIRRVGDLRAAVLMLLSGDVGLPNPGPTFDAAWYRQQASRLGASSRLAVHDEVSFTDPGLLRILF